MNQHLDVLACYAPDGATITVIVRGVEGHPIGDQELADCLRGYALLMEVEEGEAAN